MEADVKRLEQDFWSALLPIEQRFNSLDGNLGFVVQYCKTLEVGLMINTISIILLSIGLYRLNNKDR